MIGIMIFYAALFLGYIVYDSIKIARFMKQKKAMNATFFADRSHVCLLLLLAVLYLIMFALYFETAYSRIPRFEEHPFLSLFFVVTIFPLIVIAYRLILTEGLYAYTEKVLISFAYHSIPFVDLTIVKANPNWPYEIKAFVKPDAQSKRANKKIVIRTNNSHNFYLLQSLINAENA
jgi:hypothetical protein